MIDDDLFLDLAILSSSLVTILGIAYFVSIFWVFTDAQKRGINALLASGLVALLGWPLSLIGWLFVRPQKKKYQLR